MNTVRVVTGSGSGPTETAAYDAALLDAGVGNYNLVRVSSVVPPDAVVESVGTAPDLGTTGDRLTVVQARAVGRRAAAALAWARTEDGRGLFYEGSEALAQTAADASDPPAAEDLTDDALREADRGLTAGLDRREWTPVRRASATATATASAGGTVAPDSERERGDDHPETADTPLAAAVVLAVYGEGSSPF